MADEKPKRPRQTGTDQQRLSGAELARRARRELSAITGLEAESVTSLERTDDGTWLVNVELLELERLPQTEDVLGTYRVELDEQGELLRYRRVRRYARSQAGEEAEVSGG